MAAPKELPGAARCVIAMWGAAGSSIVSRIDERTTVGAVWRARSSACVVTATIASGPNGFTIASTAPVSRMKLSPIVSALALISTTGTCARFFTLRSARQSATPSIAGMN